MQPSRRPLPSIAGLTLIALTAGLTTANPAHAAPDTIRYASVKTCKTESGAKAPCGVWRLAMRSGRTVRLPAARITPRDAAGRTLKQEAAPIAISGDGGTVAYFRKSDDRLVVHRLGEEPRVMRDALAKGVGMDIVSLYLSRDGGRLAVEVGDEPERQPTLVYDVSTGADPGKLPGSLAFHGFSGDGESVLTARLAGDRTTRILTFSAAGEEGAGAEPPQVVADNPPYGLASDGTTVALFSGSARKVTLWLYDLETGTLARNARLDVRATDTYGTLSWSGETQLTATMTRPGKDDRTVERVLHIDTETRSVRVRDSFTIPADAFTYATPDA